MRIGWFSIILGALVIAGALQSEPYAFGAKWHAVAALVTAGIINIGIGIYVLRRRR